MIILHGVILSPFVRKTILCLELKNLPFRQIDVMPFSVPQGFEKVSPLKKIPAIEDNGVAIADSTVIAEYLDDQYPEYRLQPTESISKAKSRGLVDFAGSKLAEAAIGGIYFERFVKVLLLNKSTDEQRVQEAINVTLPPLLDYLESELPKQGYLFGQMGLADISIATVFITLSTVQYTIDPLRWPKLAAFIDRVKAHPLVAKQLQKEQDFIESLGIK